MFIAIATIASDGYARMWHHQNMRMRINNNNIDIHANNNTITLHTFEIDNNGQFVYLFFSLHPSILCRFDFDVK